MSWLEEVLQKRAEEYRSTRGLPSIYYRQPEAERQGEDLSFGVVSWQDLRTGYYKRKQHGDGE